MTQDKAIMLAEMARPGFQRIMAELQAYADRKQAEYDTIDPLTDPTAIMHVQVTRHIIKIAIPAIIEEIINSDKPDVPWTFKGWLRNILHARSDRGK